MSLNKSATRRLSLLAGSSIVAASLTVMAGMALPSAAMAANECGDPSANGASADFLICTPGAYAAGIDYSTTSNGDMTVILRDRVDTGTSNTAGTGAIRLFGKTGENMSLLREDTPGVIGDPRIINTAGRGVDVSTLGDGNIVINLTDGDPIAGELLTPAATAPAPMRLTGGTDAIRADAAGTGSVNVTIAQTGTASGTNHPRAIVTAGANVGSNGSGVVARSTTGAITVDVRGAAFTINGTNGGGSVDAQSVTGDVNVSANTVGGRLFGIRAQTGGAGALTVSVAAGASASAATGASIDTIAGTGVTAINVTGGTIGGGAGFALRAVSANTSATAAVNIQNTGAAISGRVDFSGATAGGVTFNNASGTWSANGTSTFGAFNDTVTFATGSVNTAANTAINLGAGNDTFTITAGQSVLAAGTVIDFGTGNDTFTLGGRVGPVGATLNFGAGTDTLNFSGVMAMDGLTVTGVEAFNLSGVILMGGGVTGTGNTPAIDYVTSDAVANDVLVVNSGTFTGSGSARVLMDFQLEPGQVQAGCATLTGAADCLDLRGASTAGVTTLTLNYIGDGATLGSYGPAGITLVDVGGAGTSAAGHFVLDPTIAGYTTDRTFGAVISRPGLVGYGLRYDQVNQRHVLVGLPKSEVFEYAVLTGAAQSIWHLTAKTVTTRQADLRDGAEADGLWLRTSGEYTQREVATSFENLGQAFAVDNSYRLYAGSVIGGADMLSGQKGDLEYVAGLQIGYVASSLDMDRTAASGGFSGATGGVYASFWSDVFFLDGTVNINGLTLDYDQPGLSSKTTTFLNAIGAQAEAGLRAKLTDSAFIEPLMNLSFVRTSFEEISLDGGEVNPADAENLRVALGMRLGGTFAGRAAGVTYYVAGRAWNEFEGETSTVINNPGADIVLTDEFTGAFGEAEFGVNVYDAGNTLSGFLTSGVKFKEGYSALTLSLGVRMAW